MGIARAGRRFTLRPQRPFVLNHPQYNRAINSQINYAATALVNSTSPVNLALRPGTVVGDTGLLIIASYNTVHTAPAGWTTWMSETTGDPRLLIAYKVLDSADISAGLITVTPPTTEQANMSLSVIRGTARIAPVGNSLRSASTSSSGVAALTPSSVLQHQVGLRAIQGGASNRTLNMISPEWNEGFISYVVGTGTNGVGMAIGSFYPRNTVSRFVDIDASNSVANSIYANFLIETPPPTTAPSSRLKRVVNAGAIRRAAF